MKRFHSHPGQQGGQSTVQWMGVFSPMDPPTLMLTAWRHIQVFVFKVKVQQNHVQPVVRTLKLSDSGWNAELLIIQQYCLISTD